MQLNLINSAWQQSPDKAMQAISDIHDRNMQDLEKTLKAILPAVAVINPSTNPLANLTNYLFKPGLPGGQISYGGTNQLDNLILYPNTFTGGSGISGSVIVRNIGATTNLPFQVQQLVGTSVFSVNGVGGVLITDPTAYASGSVNLLDISQAGAVSAPSLIARIKQGTTTVLQASALGFTILADNSGAISTAVCNMVTGSTTASVPSVLFRDQAGPTSTNVPVVVIRSRASFQNALLSLQDSSNVILSQITKDGYFSTKQLLLNGSTSGTITNTVPATVTSHTLTWPSAVGAASTFLQTDNSGNLSWATITAGSIASPAALTKADDPNVTLTLGGSPTVALLAATSIAVGWSGTLAAARLNINVVQAVTNDTNVTGSIATQTLTLGWTGTLAAARLNSNVVQSIINDTNITGSIAAQALTLGWTGTLAAARLNSSVVQAITNDTNITGSISSQTLTLGWTGTLAAARLNSNVVQSIVNDTNITGSIATQALTLAWSGTLAVTRGGTGLSSLTQGDILYASASNTLSALAKNTSSTRYLSNTGTSNNPAWAQVDLTNGVTGTLPVGNGGTGFTSLTSLFTNPTGGVNLVGANGSATTALRSDATLILDQTIAPTWTGLHTYNISTTPSDVIFLTIGASGAGNTTRDSHSITFRGTSNNTITGAHTADWKFFNDVTGSGGNSTFTIQNRVDAASFASILTLTDVGVLAVATLNLTNALGAQYGGTGNTSYAVGDILYASGSTTLSKLADVAAGSFLRSGGVTTAPAWSTTVWTNSATTGDVLYASATNTYSNLAAVATGNALISGGVTTAPSWGKIALTTHISGTLPIANGGTNLTTYAQGDLLYGSATGVLSALAKNTTATRYLSNTGTSNNPAWAQVDLTNGVTGILPAANLPSSFSGLANPAGSTQVNLSGYVGTATTALRSDAVLILDQSITPVWTGAHEHQNTVTLTGVNLVMQATGTPPDLLWYNSTATKFLTIHPGNVSSTIDLYLPQITGDFAVTGGGGDEPTLAQMVGKVNRTAQSANITAGRKLTNSAPAGEYWVSGHLACTTIDAGLAANTSITLTITWTAETGVTGTYIITRNIQASTGITIINLPAYLLSGNITWGVTGYSGTVARFAVRMRCLYQGA